MRLKNTLLRIFVPIIAVSIFNYIYIYILKLPGNDLLLLIFIIISSILGYIFLISKIEKRKFLAGLIYFPPMIIFILFYIVFFGLI